MENELFMIKVRSSSMILSMLIVWMILTNLIVHCLVVH